MLRGMTPRSARRTIGFILAACGVLAVAGRAPAAPRATPAVTLAAASSLTPLLTPLLQRFEARRGVKVNLVPGATGKLAAQIASGAPYDVFITADAETPATLAKAGKVVAGSVAPFAFGTLALWTPRANALGRAPIDTLRAARFRWLAIAEPSTAPYGRAAMECLRALGLDAALRSKLVRGESVAQTLQFTESGAADFGFVALSLLRGSKLAGRGSTWLVPDSLHAPITHTACLLAHGATNDAARDLLAFLRGPEARARLDSLGFRLP